MTKESLAANIDALKALPALVLGPQWKIRVSNFGSYALLVLGLLAHTNWAQSDLAWLIPAAWMPALGKLSAGAGSVLKLVEIGLKLQRDRALAAPANPAPPTP